MNISHKIIYSFSFLILLTFTQLGVIFTVQNKILENTKRLKDIEVPLELLDERVSSYSAMLTNEAFAALIYSEANDYKEVDKYSKRYEEIEEQMNSIIKKEAPILLGQSNRPESVKESIRETLQNLDKANTKQMSIDNNAFEAIKNKDLNSARKFLASKEYIDNKTLINEYSEKWETLELEQAVSMREDILKQSEFLTNFNIAISIFITIAIMLTLLTLKSFLNSVPCIETKN